MSNFSAISWREQVTFNEIIMMSWLVLKTIIYLAQGRHAKHYTTFWSSQEPLDQTWMWLCPMTLPYIQSGCHGFWLVDKIGNLWKSSLEPLDGTNLNLDQIVLGWSISKMLSIALCQLSIMATKAVYVIFSFPALS